MLSNRYFLLALITLFLIPGVSKASHSDETGSKPVSREDVKEFVLHHTQDAYKFEIAGVGFPLPVILIDGGLKIFSSAAFKAVDHHTSVAEIDGNYYTLSHGKIYKTTDGSGHFDHHHASAVLDFSITKNVFVIILMSIFLIVLFSRVARSYKSGLVPTGAAKFLEPIIVFVRDEIAIPNIGEKHHKKFMSFLLTIFFFIWFLNLAGLTPIGINVTGNIAVTSSLAIMVFLITTFKGNKNYWGHIFWMPGVPAPMKVLLAPIEIIGVIIKPFSLLIRLYANILAGHIVVGSLLGLIIFFNSWFAAGAFSGLTLVLSVLELLVAALQAYIFTMLAALYFGNAVEEAHH